MEYFKNGISYEERTKSTLMDGEGYITDLFNAQERAQPTYIHPTNKFFNKLYSSSEYRKHHDEHKNKKYNKILNETIKNSSPQFYVEQSFRSFESEYDKQRYKFKLDPSFLSCNSVYKTIGLRGIYMNPKRYTLTYGCQVRIDPKTSGPTPAGTITPTFEVYRWEKNYNRHMSEWRINKVEATIKLNDLNKYHIQYKQRTNYLGDMYQESTPSEFTLRYNDKSERTVYNTNKITNYDVGNGATVDFEFHPQGNIYLTIKTLSGTEHVIDEYKIEKTKPWDLTDMSCKELTISQTKHSTTTTKEVVIPFTITLLPENSIEVFASLLKEQVNPTLQTYKDNTDAQLKLYSNVFIDYVYTKHTNTLKFSVNTLDDSIVASARFVPIDDRHLTDRQVFYKILNQIPPLTDPGYTSEILYNNVWDREHFYVHASYMNLVQYNQLGRSDEVYPKPTKLTRYSSTIPDIEFWTSINGVDPFELIDQDFVITVALAATLNNADITF